jgi:hypothetical protein
VIRVIINFVRNIELKNLMNVFLQLEICSLPNRSKRRKLPAGRRSRKLTDAVSRNVRSANGCLSLARTADCLFAYHIDIRMLINVQEKFPHHTMKKREPINCE